MDVCIYKKMPLLLSPTELVEWKAFTVADYCILVISVACVCVTHHEVLLNRTPWIRCLFNKLLSLVPSENLVITIYGRGLHCFSVHTIAGLPWLHGYSRDCQIDEETEKKLLNCWNLLRSILMTSGITIILPHIDNEDTRFGCWITKNQINSPC